MELFIAIVIFDLIVWIALVGSAPFCFRKRDGARNQAHDFNLCTLKLDD